MSGVYPVVTEALAVEFRAEACAGDAADRVGLLFDVHHQRLYRIARRMARTSDDARDLVQETFLRAAQSVASIPEGFSREEAWLVRVLVNICRDGWRRAAVRKRLEPLRAVDTDTQTVSPEPTILARTTLWRALDRLPPRRRAAVVLYELEGATIPAIAKLLGVTAVTVRWHLSRGRKDLARIIGQQERAGQRDVARAFQASGEGQEGK